MNSFLYEINLSNLIKQDKINDNLLHNFFSPKMYELYLDLVQSISGSTINSSILLFALYQMNLEMSDILWRPIATFEMILKKKLFFSNKNILRSDMINKWLNFVDNDGNCIYFDEFIKNYKKSKDKNYKKSKAKKYLNEQDRVIRLINDKSFESINFVEKANFGNAKKLLEFLRVNKEIMSDIFIIDDNENTQDEKERNKLYNKKLDLIIKDVKQLNDIRNQVAHHDLILKKEKINIKNNISLIYDYSNEWQIINKAFSYFKDSDEMNLINNNLQIQSSNIKQNSQQST